jgi:hypothetical protein
LISDASEGNEETIQLDKFYHAIKGTDIPSFDREFFEYLAFIHSDSVSLLNYYKFFEIFEEGYIIDESPYED